MNATARHFHQAQIRMVLTAVTTFVFGLSAYVSAEAASRRCEALFKEATAENIKVTLPQPETRTDETIEVLLARDLIAEKLPREARSFIKDLPAFKVHHVERAIERVSLVGKQKYVAAYHRWTPVGAKPKATVVLQHGFTRSHRYFQDMRNLLLSLGYEVVAMDAANIGSTLLETLQLTGKELLRPSPLDDARALGEILDVEKIGKFILVGHSRGHAVTTLLLASGLYDRRLILHIALNPYVSWLVDTYLDGNMMANDGTRAAMNRASIPGMKAMISQSFSHLESHERTVISQFKQESAAWQIGYGLMGEMSSQRGFSVLPFYNSKLSIEESDNGFGFTSPGVRLQHLSSRVLARTRVIVSELDDVTTPASVHPLVQLLPRQDEQRTLLTSADVPADHYAPSVMPFQVVARIDRQTNDVLANPRGDGFEPRKKSAFDKTSPQAP